MSGARVPAGGAAPRRRAALLLVAVQHRGAGAAAERERILNVNVCPQQPQRVNTKQPP
jgi:hypothetical protein